MRGRWQPRGWSVCLEGNRARNCCQTGSMMYGGRAGTGSMLLLFGKLRGLPDDGVSVSAFRVGALPAYWRKLLEEVFCELRLDVVLRNPLCEGSYSSPYRLKKMCHLAYARLS